MMVEKIRLLSAHPVTAKIHKVSIWMAVLALPLVLSLVWPESTVSLQRIVGAITEHRTPTLIADKHGIVTFSNVRAAKLLRAQCVTEVVGRSVTDWMTPELAEKHNEYFQDASGRPLGSVIPLEVELQVGDNSVSASLDITLVEVDGNRIYILEFDRQ